MHAEQKQALRLRRTDQRAAFLSPPRNNAQRREIIKRSMSDRGVPLMNDNEQGKTTRRLSEYGFK
jgi:hypothetical protein